MAHLLGHMRRSWTVFSSELEANPEESGPQGCSRRLLRSTKKVVAQFWGRSYKEGSRTDSELLDHSVDITGCSTSVWAARCWLCRKTKIMELGKHERRPTMCWV